MILSKIDISTRDLYSNDTVVVKKALGASLKIFQHRVELDNPNLGNYRLFALQNIAVHPAPIRTRLLPAPGGPRRAPTNGMPFANSAETSHPTPGAISMRGKPEQSVLRRFEFAVR
jgi:hypothetical protein